MLKALKSVVRESSLYQAHKQSLTDREIVDWLHQGRPAPPPHIIKVRNILGLSDLCGAHTLVETGTLYGTTIAATKDHFRRVYSIELDPGLVAAARTRFAADRNVSVLHGDSADVLPVLLPDLPQEPVCFWLDGHYSGPGTALGNVPTPIISELNTIHSGRGRNNDLIIIDDARLFGTDEGYPTIPELTTFVEKQFGQTPYISLSDSIVILPRRS
jgi:hypothetical protein